MKIRTRLVIAFLTITLIPIILTTTMGIVLCRHQISSIEKTYGVTDTTWESLSNSMQVLSKVTEKPYEELKKIIAEDPEEMGDATRLEKVNKKLEKNKAYLLVRKGNTIVYIGTDSGETKYVIRQLPKYGEADADAKNGLYLGGNAQVLIKQIDFKYRSGEKRKRIYRYRHEERYTRSGGAFCRLDLCGCYCFNRNGIYFAHVDLPRNHASVVKDEEGSL